MSGFRRCTTHPERPRRSWARIVVLLAVVCLPLAAWAAADGAPVLLNGATLKARAIVQDDQPYLPLSAVRQIPGVTKVQWDGEQVRIITAGAGAGAGAKQASWRYLSGMEAVAPSGSRPFHSGAAKMNGTAYPKSLLASPGQHAAYVEYNLSGKYTTLEAVVGLGETSRSADTKVQFEVLGDGKSLFRSDPIGPGDSMAVHLPVAGVARLRLAISGGVPQPSAAVAVFGDARVR